jgi:hypothetical protein
VTPDEKQKLSDMLFELVPKDGTSKGNVTLLEELRENTKKSMSLNVTDEDYWEARNELIAQGRVDKGRGRGGSVYRVKDVQESEVKLTKKKVKESDLYAMVSQYIEKTWVKDNGITQFVLERTASQGKRNTGGKWTRPDFALIALKLFPYIPGKVLELISFEVKPEDDFRIEGVFETAAHSRFATRSYLLIYSPSGVPDTEEFERVERECDRFGLGLITFSNPQDWSTYTTKQEADRRNPDPADVNSFISTQVSRDKQTRVLEMVK